MDEFVKLYLTGERAEDMIRFNRIARMAGLLGALFNLIPSFLSLFFENGIVTIVLATVAAGFGVASWTLAMMKSSHVRGLAELQRAADETECRGEERLVRAAFFEAWKEAFRPLKIRTAVFGVLYLLGYAALLCIAICTGLGLLPAEALPLGCCAAVLLLGGISVAEAVSEGRARARLYEKAGGEIDAIKRNKFGMTEDAIGKEAENAAAFSAIPQSVALFLKEDTERAEFKEVAKKSGIRAVIFEVILIGGIVAAIAMEEIWKRVGATTAWSVVLLYGFFATVAFLALCLPLEGRKKHIYRRNAEKLGSGEADLLRAELQRLWILSQRAGNIMFGGFLGVSVLVGLILGIVGYAMGTAPIFVESVGSSIVACVIFVALPSLAVWTVMYAVFRRKARPKETRLRELLREEWLNGREG